MSKCKIQKILSMRTKKFNSLVSEEEWSTLGKYSIIFYFFEEKKNVSIERFQLIKIFPEPHRRMSCRSFYEWIFFVDEFQMGWIHNTSIVSNGFSKCYSMVLPFSILVEQFTGKTIETILYK